MSKVSRTVTARNLAAGNQGRRFALGALLLTAALLSLIVGLQQPYQPQDDLLANELVNWPRALSFVMFGLFVFLSFGVFISSLRRHYDYSTKETEGKTNKYYVRLADLAFSLVPIEVPKWFVRELLRAILYIGGLQLLTYLWPLVFG